MNVTVVISNYNYGTYVASAIESCLAQTAKCRIIVVDDCSTDLSWDMISKYKGKIRAVQLSSNSGGNARGKNVGIALAETEFVTCLDADDMLTPHSLECRLEAIGDADFCHGWCHITKSKAFYCRLVEQRPVFKNPDATKKYTDNIIHKQGKLGTEKAHRYSVVIPASTVLARRKIYDELGLYDEWLRWSIDREMWCRWLFHEKRMVEVPNFVSIYRKHGRNITMNPGKKKPGEVQERYRKCVGKRCPGLNRRNTAFLSDYEHRKYIAREL